MNLKARVGRSRVAGRAEALLVAHGAIVQSWQRLAVLESVWNRCETLPAQADRAQPPARRGGGIKSLQISRPATAVGLIRFWSALHMVGLWCDPPSEDLIAHRHVRFRGMGVSIMEGAELAARLQLAQREYAKHDTDIQRLRGLIARLKQAGEDDGEARELLKTLLERRAERQNDLAFIIQQFLPAS